MKTKTKLLSCLLLVLCYLPMQGQVTIGDGTPPRDFSVLEVSTKDTRGGLRLPQLSTQERNAWRDYFLKVSTGNPVKPSGNVTADELANAPGLAIFNTTTQCYEYWNSVRWVSLCEGSSLMTIDPEPCPADADGNWPDGSLCGDGFTVTDPDCENGPFTILIVAGQDYAQLTGVNETDGMFGLSFQPNNSINQRSVVVRVTSSCTGLYKDFLFLQDGYDCSTSNLGTAPEIHSEPSGNNIKFCANGAVYLSIDATTITAPATLADVIWTRNNIEFARGVNNIVVTQEGKYDVWMGHIGCGQRPNNTVTVTREGIGAPQPVNIVVNGNNGMVCGPDGTTTLVAMNPNGSGTVLWFKNGVKAVKNTDYTVTTTDPSYVRIEVGTGDWFAVVTDGTTCYSRPSQTVSVIENLESGQLDKFSIAYPAFCAGGTVLLSVSGGNTTYTYTWYANNTQIGVGSSVLYTVPSDVSPVVIRCRATLAGSCAREAIAIETIDAGTIPSPPIIGGSMVLCDGTGTLNVRPSDTSTGTYEYAWYLNNALMGTGQQLPITSGGTYYATVAKDGCTSPMVSRNIPMVSSAAPVIELVSYAQTPGKVNLGDKVKYEVNVKAGGPVNGYQWALENASLAPGYNLTDATIYVIYDQTTGDASVRVTAGNQCGDSSPAIRPVQVGEDCAAVTDVRSQDATTKNVLTGFSASLGAVNALFDEGNPPRTFQWYTTVDQKNNTPADDMPIAGAVDNVYTTPVYDAAGTYYYYCKVANAGTNCSDKFGNSAVYTVKVTVLPTTPGSGTFTGRTCFDINKSNFGGDCGSQEMRAYYMADFANLGPVTYTFTASASGTKSNLRFWVVDPEECVSSYSGGKEGTIANNEVITLTVNYKTSLSADGGLIFGRTQANAAQLTIYAIYNNGTQDVSVPLKVRIQDCSCCGAYMADGKWKAFMCHNLGADYTLDPFTPAQGLNGDYYQWGRPTPAASPDALYGPWVTTNPSNTAWSTGSRTANDPCPPGSHVPKLTDFGFASKNTLRYTPASTWTNSPTNYTSGMHVGEHLYLPAAGYRSSASGALTNHGATGYYYTSNVAAANDAHETRFSMSGPPAPVIGMSLGESIRCISL